MHCHYHTVHGNYDDSTPTNTYFIRCLATYSVYTGLCEQLNLNLKFGETIIVMAWSFDHSDSTAVFKLTLISQMGI